MSNIWSDDWESLGETEWEAGAKSTRLPRGDVLGASIYELPPGGRSTYHFHHGSEELLVVLGGRVTLRTPDGERELEEGEVVHFPTGPAGAHEQLNHTGEPVRYFVVSNRVSPEVVEYPDTRQITAQGRHGSQTGEPLWLIHDLASGDLEA
jgi:uncharacterized cupin superfamily protein